MNSQLGICIYNVGTDYITEHKFKRIQLCHKFSNASDITSLLKLNKNYPIRVSYHAPVFHQVDPTLTYYLSKNMRLREATFEILEINLKMATSLPTDYVVVHFTSRAMDMDISDEELKELAKKSIKRINKLSIAYKLPIYIEYAVYNDRLRMPQEWVDLVKDYDNLGLCLDIGQLYNVCKDCDLDYFKELERLLPFTKAIHIWNTKSNEDLEKYGYIPVHPSQSKEDGWIDIEKTLEISLLYNEDMYIIFEPNFKYKDKEYFEEGVKWVNEMVCKFTNVRKTAENL
ncbi:hypothetical protein CLPU_2c01390 [Gottschalkia purinilytica]|uniref:Xylose isomerase-like TIM barrel domain-containing protein n=1 Tax=Gottschalkia purinilytica TaxID=1503 RepID=A0A0L0WDY1_GOTPU|nr:TIM barrel protein [Gottschalkia purinilytica]KNF09687.1 hypothetical protein CLPU_2c01390 [Gottschalkia purinilytica]